MASDAQWRQQQELEEQRFAIECAPTVAEIAALSKQTRKEKTMFKMKASNSGGDFKNASPGTVGAVCTRLVDLGTQTTNFGDKRQVSVSFEIDEKMDDGRPFLVSKRYTLSVHEKASLRKDMEAWRGKRFADGEEIDIAAIVGKPCLLNLVETDKGYINIGSISPLPKGMPALAPAAGTITFSLDDPDWDAFNELSEYFQNLIAATPEYKDTAGIVTPTPAPTTQQGASQAFQKPAPRSTKVAEPMVADFDDEIPF